MYRRILLTVGLVILGTLGLLPAAGVARAIAQTPQSEISGCRVSEMTGATQDVMSKDVEGRVERVLVLTGEGAVPVQVDCDDTQFFADFAEIYPDSHRIVATGNVKVGSPTSFITAERVEFDTKSRTGVFYTAHGMASLGDRVDRSMFGTQEADALFRGREIHKLGPKKYRIVDGAFSTCVQPTPRWEVVSGNATLNLDDYALLKNSVFRVKGVPLMYLPLFYYPIQEDDRATGFLIPTYGASSIKGQSLSNAFFWAISRSQDATFVHDWFSKAGQQMGGEYRYVVNAGSQGNARVSFLDEKGVETAPGTTTGGRRSYQITGGMTQGISSRIRARANADYVSDLAPDQLYQQDVYRATRSTRSFGGNVTGNWTQFVLSGTLDRTDVFYPDGTYTTYGGLPRVNFNRPERRIGRSPFYFGAGGESATLLRSTVRDEITIQNQGLTRLDFTPTLRIPFTRWPFLSINSSIGWRATYWTESLVNGVQVDESIGRQFFDLYLAGDWTRLQPDLQLRRDRRPETQARHRTRLRDPPSLGHRRFRSHRSARVARLHCRQRLGIQLRAQQSPLRQADHVTRSSQRRAEPELLHRRARGAVRSAISEQQLQRHAPEQIHGARPPGARGADRTAAGRLPDRVGSDVQDTKDIRRQRQH